MKKIDFIKDKKLYIILTVFLIITCEILLIPFKMSIFIKAYIGTTPLIILIIVLTAEYYKKKAFYNKLMQNMEELKEKYLISEIISTPDFMEGRILKELLNDLSKSMIENVNNYKYQLEDYKEFIELWIHEIKMPIATSKMIIENNKNEITKSIDEEIDKIDNYVEQALFYARSNTVEKDYCIKKTNLQDLINSSIIKNKKSLLKNKISVNIHDVDVKIYTDGKWVIFILNQIIQNSIKYLNKETKNIEFRALEEKEKVNLYIKDNGMGIKQSDLSRVFDKGFTGENGRKTERKSTGIGLYLCKKLCDKLGLSIDINSEVNEYTEVVLTFPKGSFWKF